MGWLYRDELEKEIFSGHKKKKVERRLLVTIRSLTSNEAGKQIMRVKVKLHFDFPRTEKIPRRQFVWVNVESY